MKIIVTAKIVALLIDISIMPFVAEILYHIFLSSCNISIVQKQAMAQERNVPTKSFVP